MHFVDSYFEEIIWICAIIELSLSIYSQPSLYNAKQQCFDVQLKNVADGNIYNNFQNFWISA